MKPGANHMLIGTSFSTLYCYPSALLLIQAPTVPPNKLLLLCSALRSWEFLHTQYNSSNYSCFQLIIQHEKIHKYNSSYIYKLHISITLTSQTIHWRYNHEMHSCSDHHLLNSIRTILSRWWRLGDWNKFSSKSYFSNSASAIALSPIKLYSAMHASIILLYFTNSPYGHQL